MQLRLSLVVLLSFVLSSPSAVSADANAEFDYSLDSLERVANPKGKMRCPKVEMTKHNGGTVRYHKPVYVYVDFKERLVAFEDLVAEVAIEVYGRAPKRIKHMGTFNCRRIKRFPDLLSEHALGNAIDVEGFDFGPAKGSAQKAESPHRRLRRGFKVRVGKHWDRDRGVAAVHSNFLHKLTERLIEEDTFRVLLGPAWPGHKNHFHFDLAPYRLVEL
jgi:hypothetical protein